jgi:LysM repeat protein
MKKILLSAFVLISFLIKANIQDSVGVEMKEGKKFVKYLVTAGETLYKISSSHKVSMDDLLADNPTLKDGLKVGQTIYLRNYINPNKSQTAPTAAKPETHLVQKGETYYSISKKYGIPVETLQKWNGTELKEGQTLNLKEPKNIVTTNTKPTTSNTSTPVQTTMEPEKTTTDSKPANQSVAQTKPDSEVKPTTTETKPNANTSSTTQPVTSTNVETQVEPIKAAVEEIPFKIPVSDPYEYNPNKQQVLVIPFDPHLYWSDADVEIAKGSGLVNHTEVRKIIRRRLNALIDPMGFETIQLLGGQFKDTITDLNKIYKSVSYDYQEVILSDKYKKILEDQAAREAAAKAEQQKGDVSTKTSAKDKFNQIKNKAVEVANDVSGNQPTQSKEDEQNLDNKADQYFGVIVRDSTFFEYFNQKYSVDYYIFVNQFEVITDYDHCLDRTTENYVRKFVVHFSIFDSKGKQIAGNKFIKDYNSNSNNVDKITGDNLQPMADRILLELPLPK